MKLRTVVLFVLYFSGQQLFSQSLVDPSTPIDASPLNTVLEKKWKLDFSDEFNSNSVDPNKWMIDESLSSRASRPNIGIYDWRWKPDNVSLKDGNLILKVVKTGTNSMTNGSINSRHGYLVKYGYFEARIKIADAAKGTHTAFWLQGPNMGNVDGTANDGAEIDIFESAWVDDYTKAVVHIDGYGANHQSNTKKYDTPEIHSAWHTWGFHWTENFMHIYYDGELKVRYDEPKWVVRANEYLWLSNGASFGLSGNQYFLDLPVGYLTESQIDYIRVWKEVNDSLLSRKNWKLLYADSEDKQGTGNPATNAFDGKLTTFWHTEWFANKPDYPHEIQIDLGDTAKIYGFKYLPRQDNNPNGTIAAYDFYASMDQNNWGAPKKSGIFSSNDAEKRSILPDTITCRYIRLVAKSEINGNPFASIAELNMMGFYIGENPNVPTGTTELQNESAIRIYPNPFSSEINLKHHSDQGISYWKIYSINGSLLREGHILPLVNKLTIETGDIKPGTYIFEVIGSKGIDKKLMIKK